MIDLHNKFKIIDCKEEFCIIYNCKHSTIFLKNSFKYLLIIKCKNCKIFVESVSHVTHIENSLEINFTGITSILNISNVLNAKINTFC